MFFGVDLAAGDPQRARALGGLELEPQRERFEAADRAEPERSGAAADHDDGDEHEPDPAARSRRALCTGRVDAESRRRTDPPGFHRIAHGSRLSMMPKRGATSLVRVA